MSFSSLDQRARVLTLALFVFLSINKVNSQSRVPSPSDAVCEPTFELRDGRTLVSGKASAVRLASGRVVLITVMHSFGPAGGLNAVIPPESLPELVSQTILSDPQTGQEVGRTGAELLSTGDGYPPDADYSKDLAAFDLNPGYRRRVFSLHVHEWSRAACSLGCRRRIIAPVPHHKTESKHQHSGNERLTGVCGNGRNGRHVARSRRRRQNLLQSKFSN